MYKAGFRECKKEDYVANGLKIDLNMIDKTLNNRFCPDMSSLKDIIQVKNGYFDHNERYSFDYNIVLCDKE